MSDEFRPGEQESPIPDNSTPANNGSAAANDDQTAYIPGNQAPQYQQPPVPPASPVPPAENSRRPLPLCRPNRRRHIPIISSPRPISPPISSPDFPPILPSSRATAWRWLLWSWGFCP